VTERSISGDDGDAANGVVDEVVVGEIANRVGAGFVAELDGEEHVIVIELRVRGRGEGGVVDGGEHELEIVDEAQGAEGKGEDSGDVGGPAAEAARERETGDEAKSGEERSPALELKSCEEVIWLLGFVRLDDEERDQEDSEGDEGEAASEEPEVGLGFVRHLL
jgi:hypothetical protein